MKKNQLTLSGYSRDKLTKFLLSLGWSYFDARCLMRSRFRGKEVERIKEMRITKLQRRLLFDDGFQRAKLGEMVGRMEASSRRKF